MLVETIPQSSPSRAAGYPVCRSAIPEGELRAGRYSVRFARTRADLHAVQRLRFRVFNLELGEGLESAYATGRDEDAVDATCHHLMVHHRRSGDVVGTYRLMIRPMAEARGGFYSESEFDFSTLPESICNLGVELGRACVRDDHRNGRVIHLLWRGLARYLAWNDRRFLFGCGSLPTLDQAAALRAYAQLEASSQLHPTVELTPWPEFQVGSDIEPAAEPFELPPLLGSYLSLGARVASRPAVDREFKVIDLFIVLDVERMQPKIRQSLMSQARWNPLA